jgi:Secretion system C-terminal sorting domain
MNKIYQITTFSPFNLKNKFLLVFSLYFCTFLDAQHPIIENYQLPASIKITDFPALSSFHKAGKNSEKYWLLDNLDFYERDTQVGSSWVLTPLPSFGFYDNQFVDTRGGLFRSTTKIDGSNSSYNSTFNLLKTDGSVLNETLMRTEMLGVTCPNPASNCSPWFGGFAIIDQGFIYFNAFNTNPFLYSGTRKVTINGGLTWESTGIDFPINVIRADNKFVSFDTKNLYVGDNAAFNPRNTYQLPDSLVHEWDIIHTWFEDNTLYMLHKDGKIWKNLNLGNDWQTVHLPFENADEFWRVQSYYFLRNSKGLFRSEQLLEEYTQVFPNGLVPISSILSAKPIDTSEWLIGVPNLGIWHSNDKGNTWESFSEGLPRKGVDELKKINHRLFNTDVNRTNYWYSNIDGTDWNFATGEQLGDHNYIDIFPSDSIAYFMGRTDFNQRIFHTNDGINLLSCDTLMGNFYPFCLVSENNLLFTDLDSNRVREVDLNCEQKPSFALPYSSGGSPIRLNTFYSLKGGDTLLILEGAELWRTMNRGLNWEIIPLPTSNPTGFLSILHFNGKIIFAENSLRIWETSDFGQTWSKLSDGIVEDIFFRYEVKENLLFAEPTFTTIANEGWYVSKNPGEKWLKVSSTFRPSLYKFDFLDSMLFFSPYATKGLYRTNINSLFDKLGIVLIAKDAFKESKQNIFNFTISPNPVSSDEVYIKILDTERLNGSLSFINQLGQILLKKEIKNPTETINISNYPNGIYFIKIATQGQRTQVKRLIINRMY